MPQCLCGTGDAAWAWMAMFLSPRRASRQAGEGRPQPRGRTARHVRAHIEPTCCIPNLTFEAARRPANAGTHVAPDQKCHRLCRETWMPAAAGMTGETETSLISTDPVDDYAAPNPTCERPRGPRRRIAAPTKPKPAISNAQLAGSGTAV